MFALGTDVACAGKSPAAKVKSWKNLPLTPGKIPNFIIPPKLQLSFSPRPFVRRGVDPDEHSLLPLSSPEEASHEHGSPLASPRFSAKLRFTPRSNRKRARDDLSEPSSRAAMSLEHVEKVTTPYGFCTLAASPHVGRRESLFHKRTRSVAEERSSSTTRLDSPMAMNARSGQESCSSAQKPVRRGLKLFLRSPRAALKTLTPSPMKNRLRKAQKEL